MSRYYLIILLIIMPFHLMAEINIASNQAYPDEANNGAVIPELEVGQWNVSMAFGLGLKSNPLVGGDNIPLILLPDISFYGEKIYFDNGDLGYTFNEIGNHSLSLLTRFNFEKAYFSRTHPANILIPPQSAVSLTDAEIENLQRPSIDDIKHRDYAIDLGLQYNYFVSDTALFRLQILADASQVYNGFNGMIEYQFQSNFQQLNVTTTIGLAWKSRELVDYYYGIDGADDVNPIFYYQGKSSINPYLKLAANYPLNAEWRIISMLQYSSLGSGITESPIVEASSTHTIFVGVAYQL